MTPFPAYKCLDFRLLAADQLASVISGSEADDGVEPAKTAAPAQTDRAAEEADCEVGEQQVNGAKRPRHHLPDHQSARHQHWQAEERDFSHLTAVEKGTMMHAFKIVLYDISVCMNDYVTVVYISWLKEPG